MAASAVRPARTAPTPTTVRRPAGSARAARGLTWLRIRVHFHRVELCFQGSEGAGEAAAARVLAAVAQAGLPGGLGRPGVAVEGGEEIVHGGEFFTEVHGAVGEHPPGGVRGY